MNSELWGEDRYPALTAELRGDCTRCAGLCCTALWFSKSDGFPADKPSGVPCRHLRADWLCAIHDRLEERGCRGCRAYDCLGAGQRAAALCSGLRENGEPEGRAQLCAVFLTLVRLRQTLWYLVCAASLRPAGALLPGLERLLAEEQRLEAMLPQPLPAGAEEQWRKNADRTLRRAISLTQQQVLRGRPARQVRDGAGRRLRGSLTGADFGMGLLIAADLSGCVLTGANFLGADLRDADLRGADLSGSIFLTQSQINAARGDGTTRLPPRLKRPEWWCEKTR